MAKMSKEAKARIKINKLLEDAGWRLLDDENGKANVELEQGVSITKEDIDALIDGRKQNAVLMELLTKQGAGTLIKK